MPRRGWPRQRRPKGCRRAIRWRGERGGGGAPTLLERERILLTIGRYGEVVQKRLSEMLQVSPQSMSESLAKLEHDGYIIRSKNQLDKRETIVALTASGQERSDWLKGKAREQAHRFLEPLNIEEKQTLYTLLRKLTTRGSEN